MTTPKTSALLRLSDISPKDRGGGLRTYPLVRKATGATDFINGVTEFDTAFSWPTFAASVEAVPAATLVTWRSLPTAPIDTEFARSATELAPRATAFAPDATAAPPIATAFVPVADESASVEFEWKYVMPPPLFT